MTKLRRPRDNASPIIVWLRQDLRLADNPSLTAALRTGRPVIPLFILHEAADGRPWGAASRWWLDKSLRALDADLRRRGSRLILRRGDPAIILPALAQNLGAGATWSRLYGGVALERGLALTADLEAATWNASLLTEPWCVKTAAGQPFQMFTPFWKAVRPMIADKEPWPAPDHIPAPDDWPDSDDLDNWSLHPRGPDWSRGFDIWTPGEAGALARLDIFLRDRLKSYSQDRDRPDLDGGSGLSPHLHWGEIGPRQVRAAVLQAVRDGVAPAADADKLMAELGWREFNHHLLFAHGALHQRNIRRDFDAFPWRRDPEALQAWREGRTGYPMVDAGMRQLWATGFMHNRVRMIAASFLIKHLLIDWREGEAWFWDTLVDADEANNPANWQWSAGSGADAAPFFRVFNPVLQGQRYDPDGAYVRRWIPELKDVPDKMVHRPWDAGGAPGYPAPIVDQVAARARALEAFRSLRTD
jgi:deoxyribodipyrimidine photo-lyase